MTKFAILWLISSTGGLGTVPIAVFATIGECDTEYARISKQSEYLGRRLICTNSSKLYFSLPMTVK